VSFSSDAHAKCPDDSCWELDGFPVRAHRRRLVHALSNFEQFRSVPSTARRRRAAYALPGKKELIIRRFAFGRFVSAHNHQDFTKHELSYRVLNEQAAGCLDSRHQIAPLVIGLLSGAWPIVGRFRKVVTRKPPKPIEKGPSKMPRRNNWGMPVRKDAHVIDCYEVQHTVCRPLPAICQSPTRTTVDFCAP